jgi:dTDP-L-rhamnose 4-epimerase
VKGRILVTGGAGFIGCHLVRALLRGGYEVRVLDSFVDQVHRGAPVNPLMHEVELIEADVRDSEAVRRALAGVDKLVHLAAEVGVGQSMYAIDRYVSVNDRGTAVLFEALLTHPVVRVVVASSMSIYGEGLYRTAAGKPVEDVVRPFSHLAGDGWDPAAPDGSPLVPVPTPEWKRPSLASVYAITKYVQERLTLTVPPAYGMEAVALRLFNVFGPGQALSNPYTGVLAIFAARLLNRRRPPVFEDGAQMRDFVHVEDVAQGFVLALEQPAAAGGVFNIGSGQAISIAEVGAALARAMNCPGLEPELIGKLRSGDVRHCFADIRLAQARLGYKPKRKLQQSLGQLAEWVAMQSAADNIGQARAELESRGLVT